MTRRIPKLTADELERRMALIPGSRIERDPDTDTRHLVDATGRELAWSAGGAA